MLMQELEFKTLGETLEYLLSFDEYLAELRKAKLEEKLLEIDYKLKLLERKRELIRRRLNNVERFKGVEELMKRLKECERKVKEKETNGKVGIEIYNKISAFLLAKLLKNNKELRRKVLSAKPKEALSLLQEAFPELPITVEAVEYYIINHESLEKLTLYNFLEILKRTT